MSDGMVRICFEHRGFAHKWEDACNVAQLTTEPTDCRIEWRTIDKPARCRSIGVMPVGPAMNWPQCELEPGHDDDHEGQWRERKVLWDTSPVVAS